MFNTGKPTYVGYIGDNSMFKSVLYDDVNGIHNPGDNFTKL